LWWKFDVDDYWTHPIIQHIAHGEMSENLVERLSAEGKSAIYQVNFSIEVHFE
jgi:hypothetical protein